MRFKIHAVMKHPHNMDFGGCNAIKNKMAINVILPVSFPNIITGKTNFRVFSDKSNSGI